MRRVTRFYSGLLNLWVVIFRDSLWGMHWRPSKHKTRWKGPYPNAFACLQSASREHGMSMVAANWRREDRL